MIVPLMDVSLVALYDVNFKHLQKVRVPTDAINEKILHSSNGLGFVS